MGIDQWVNVGGSILACAACAFFALTYHLRARWWRSEMGRNLMGFAGVVGALCLYTVLVSLWPDGCLATILRGVRTALALAITGLMVQRTRLLLQAQRDHRSKHDRTGV